MKKLIVLLPLVCLALSNAYAKELNNFTEIKEVVKNGSPIRIAIDFPKCTKFNLQHAVNIDFGIFSPNEIIINDQNQIVASLKHFTWNHPNFPHQAIEQVVRYTINDNNNVILDVQLLEAKNYLPIMAELHFNCKLGSAAKVYN